MKKNDNSNCVVESVNLIESLVAWCFIVGSDMFLSCTLSLLVVADLIAGFSLEAQYSALSGLVAEAAFSGDNATHLVRLALDFKRSDSKVFDPSVCPPFVECAELSFDDRFRTTQHLSIADSDIGLFGGLSVTDELVIGGVVVERFSFQLVRNWNPRVAAFRDVGGIVGVSKYSQIFRGKCIAIEDGLAGLRFNDCVDSAESGGHQRFRFEPRGDHEWRFRGSVFLSNRLALDNVKVQFDPSLQDIVIPRWFMGGFLERFSEEHPGIVRESRLNVPCEVVENVSLTLLVEAVFPVHVSPASLLKEPVVGNPSLCSLRIRFDDVPHLFIGRHLIHSVRAVELDHRNGFKMSLFPLPAMISHSIEPDVTFVPIYSGQPAVGLEDGNPVVSFSRTDNTESAYVLLRHGGRRAGLGELVWTFLRLGESLVDSELQELVVEPAFGGFSFVVNPSSVEFKGTRPGGFRQLVIRTLARSIEVMLRPVVVPDQSGPARISELRLPDPEHVSDTDAEITCSICLERISAADVAQRICECDHLFHRECVKQWVESRSATCPNCRGVIPRRPLAPHGGPETDCECCIIS